MCFHYTTETIVMSKNSQDKLGIFSVLDRGLSPSVAFKAILQKLSGNAHYLKTELEVITPATSLKSSTSAHSHAHMCASSN